MNTVHVGTYVRIGGTWGLRLPPAIRKAMGFVRGDAALMQVLGDTLVIKRASPNMIIDRKKVEAAASNAAAVARVPDA